MSQARRQYEAKVQALQKAEAEIERLKAEFDEIRKDAARYRWVRDDSVPPHNFYLSVPDEFHGERYKPYEVDAYIDAAIKAMEAK